MMQMNVLSTELKRQVIEIGLLAYLHGEQLAHALRHWETHYCYEPSYALNRFLNDICQTEDLKPLRRNLLKSLFVEINFVETIEDIRQNIHDVLARRQELRLMQQGVLVLIRAICSQLSSQHHMHFMQEIQDKVAQKIQQPLDAAQLKNEAWVYALDPVYYPEVIVELQQRYAMRYGVEKAAEIMEWAKLKVMKQYPNLNIGKLMAKEPTVQA